MNPCHDTMQRYVLFLMVTVVLSAGVAGVVAADGGPLAAAGLDQEVGVNTTVQLDGTGSSHPDGRIDGYEWSIERPDGRTVTPDCRTCARTQFRPRSVGRYDVTLTVTDREGRTDADTLYIYVEEAGPSVELSGDAEPAVDDPTPYNVSARARGADLETLTWKLGDRTVVRESMDGQADWTERSFSFTKAETYPLVVIARDSSNRTARDTLTVEPREAPEAGSGDGGASGGTTIPASNFSTAADDAETNAGCENAAVVGNPTGSGTAAAVFCVDENSAMGDRYADETCSGDIKDCKYAEPDGISSPASESGGDGVGSGFSGSTSTHLDGGISYNTGRSSPSAERSDAFAGTTGNNGII
jgi:hypothetical protein